MKYRKIIIVMLTTGIFYCGASAQQILQGFESTEILKIAEVYRNTPDLSFNVSYTYVDSAYPGNILEQLTGNYKIKDGKYWSFIDSTEYLQGNLYSLTVFHRDSSITVSEKSIYGDLLRVSVLDSLFQAGNVNSMSVTTVNDSTRSLLMRFNTGSYYRKYELQYDPAKYLIKKLEYHIKENSDSVITSGIGIITMTFSSYSGTTVDPEVFNENKFIYRIGDYIYTKPAYGSFRLLVNVPGVSSAPL